MKKSIRMIALTTALTMPVCSLISMQPAPMSIEQAKIEWLQLFNKMAYSQPVDIEHVKKLIASGVDINTLDEDNSTLLGKAIYHKNKELAQLLISQGASVTLTPAQSQLGIAPATPLNQAISTRDAAFVKLVLDAGAPIQAGRLEYPLHVAVANRSMSIVKLLLDYGADVNYVQPDGDTPLHYAVKYAPAIIPLLLEYGADMSLKNKAGQTALDLAKARIQGDASDENAQNALQFLTTQKLK